MGKWYMVFENPGKIWLRIPLVQARLDRTRDWHRDTSDDDVGRRHDRLETAGGRVRET